MSDSEDLNSIPRRLRRFYRKGQLPPEGVESSEERMQKVQQEMKKQSSELAQKEIRHFKERFKRFPKNGEFDEIAENVYSQAKTQNSSQESKESHGRFRHSKTEETPSERKIADLKKQGIESKQIPEEKKILSNIKDLLEEDKETKQAEEKKEELELSDLNIETEDLQKSLDELPDEESESFIKETKSAMNTCPNCGTKTEHLVFCPDCGAAFCAHCAKQTKSIDDKISYTCPKCNSEFKARKTS